MKTSLFYGLLCSLLLFASCNTLDNNSNGDKAYEESWVIGSKTVIDNDGLRNFWVKKNGNPVWERCSSAIENFDYEEGYEYLADIKVTTVTNPPQDGSSLKYSLLRIISKEQKESDVPILTNDLSKCFGSPELAFPELQNNSIHSDIQKSGPHYILQGDILLSPEQAYEAITKSGCITDRTKYWPNNTIYYTFSSDFTYQPYVSRAIEEWETKTSLKFINGTGRGNYIEFIHGDGNYSYLGLIGGKQAVSLALNGSNSGTAIHEIGHAAGLIHEHCRNDRDSYITIHFDNIQKDKQHNFNLYPAGKAADIGTFDFNSIMLYSSGAFSANGMPTMTTKDGLYFTGQRSRLSPGDIEGISAIYGPPFHKLNTSINVLRDEVNGLTEVYEYTANYVINIYEDRDCKQSAVLKYPRTITVYMSKCIYDTNTNRMKETIDSWNITIPAGQSSYNIGSVHNIQKYLKSNPEEYDVTSYSIDEYPALR
ncbi:MAG: DUF4377 domain-containing protein [Bacteroidales bacterium]|nr:DUF4377 domain-containing protein [Bacteroidales bacterium]